MPIDRTALNAAVDDDGTNTTGTLISKAWLAATMFDQIDTLFAGISGTWTPSDGSGAALALTVGTAKYVKVGRLVFVSFVVTYPATASGAVAVLRGLPYQPSAIAGDNHALAIGYTSVAGLKFCAVHYVATADGFVYFNDNAGNMTNAQMTTGVVHASGVYLTATP